MFSVHSGICGLFPAGGPIDGRNGQFSPISIMKFHYFALLSAVLLTMTNCSDQDKADEAAASPYEQASAAEARGEGANALTLYKQAAEQGDARAMLKLGEFALKGAQGVEKNPAAAVEWYTKASRAGSPRALHLLGLCADTGTGMKKDPEKALDFWRRAAKAGESPSMVMLGLACARGYASQPRDDEAAARYYRQAAERGSADGCFNLAACHDTGRGVPKDQKEAVRWARQAAEQGHPMANDFMGKAYTLGYGGCERSEQAALPFYRKAAGAGVPDSLCALGKMALAGRVMKEDPPLAFRCFSDAAKRGHAEALCLLGMCYDTGTGTQKNAAKAVEAWKQAADRKNARAACYLGRCVARGHAVKKDEALATKLFALAASLGDAEGCLEYGLRLLRGTGCEADSEKGREFVARACRANLPQAWLELGRCHMDGIGMAKDAEKARTCWEHAAKAGNEEAARLLAGEKAPQEAGTASGGGKESAAGTDETPDSAGKRSPRRGSSRK